MNRQELRATGALAGIFALRLLDLFMIYPVFLAYVQHWRGATSERIGLAFAAYGPAQGVLQIPFGLFSDRLGRKLVISFEPRLFALGSIVAAMATTIDGVLVGRVLQGTGAVGSAVLALIADLTREEVRTRAMAVVGITIGFSFVIAIAAGSVLATAIGVPDIFWPTAALALIGVGIMLLAVPTPPRLVRHHDADAVPALFARVCRNGELLCLDFAIFTLHTILTASFLAIPSLLVRTLHLTGTSDWRLYLPIMAMSIVLMVPIVILAKRGARMKEVFLLTIAMLAVSLAAFAAGGGNAVIFIVALVVFFGGFNAMEVLLPSLVTKTAPAGAKDTATGVYSSSQFLGIFCGGPLGGWALAAGGDPAVFSFALMVALVWLALAATMRRPARYRSQIVRLNDGALREPASRGRAAC